MPAAAQAGTGRNSCVRRRTLHVVVKPMGNVRMKLYVDAFGKISDNADRILELVKEQSN